MNKAILVLLMLVVAAVATEGYTEVDAERRDMASATVNSYHIAMGYNEADELIMVWPACGFGQYCTDLKEAEAQLAQEIKDEPNRVYELIQLTAVVDPQSKKILGVRSSPKQVLAHYPIRRKK